MSHVQEHLTLFEFLKGCESNFESQPLTTISIYLHSIYTCSKELFEASVVSKVY